MKQSSLNQESPKIYKFNYRKSRMIFFIILMILISLFFPLLYRLSVPLVFAYVISLIFKQLVPPFTKIGLNRSMAYLLIFGILILILAYPVIKILPIASYELGKIQDYIPKVDTFLRTSYDDIQLKLHDKFSIDLGERHLQDFITYVTNESKNMLLKLPSYIGTLFEWSILIPIFLFFILKDGFTARKNFLKLIPNPIFERSYFLWAQFNKQLGEYIFAKFIEATIIGIITTVGLIFLKIPFAILLGTAAALTNIIPYLGPVLGIIPAIIVASIEYGPFSSVTFGVLILFFIANLIDTVLVFPILVSKIVNMHPILVIFSVILGSQYMGVVGMIISIPLAAIGKLIFAEVYKELYPINSRQNDLN